MNVILEGKDWSHVASSNDWDFGVNKTIAEVEESNDTDKENEENSVSESVIFARDYFERYRTLTSAKSPFNLGLYQTIFGQKGLDFEGLKSTQYIGIVPLLKINDDTIDTKSEQRLIKISSRFGISPTEMIKEVLDGDDYYENPQMLSTKSYGQKEWLELSNCKWDDKKKEIFGVISGIGQIDIAPKSEDGKDNLDINLAEELGAFEIIDFVNKAKVVCKSNLKKQSQRVEENLNCKVKGRILIQKQIKYNLSKGQRQKTYCQYNKMSDDIIENQIIKYALHLCQKTRLGDSLAEDINACLNTLRGVPLKKCSASDFVGLKNNGAYKQYKDVLASAKKIIGRYSIEYSKSNENGDTEAKAVVTNTKMLPYYIDMNLLFEYYCRALFRKAIDEYNIKNEESIIRFSLESAKDARRLLFNCSQEYLNKLKAGNEDDLDYQNILQNFFMPTYIPDIVVNYQYGERNGIAAVFDAKYSDVENKEKRSRTHQVMFYMKALGCDDGGLISPRLKNIEVPEEGYEDSIYINRKLTDGIKEFGDNLSNPKLYYIPLNDANGKTEDYIKIIINYLDGIALRIIERENSKEKDALIREIYEKYLANTEWHKGIEKKAILELISKIKEIDGINTEESKDE